MSSCICVLGVAWLGTTFVSARIDQIIVLADSVLETKPWLLAVVLFFAAVSSLLVLPTYPTLLAAVEFDNTGATRIGKYVFDHPFLIPGLITIASAVLLGFRIAPLII